MSQTRAESMKQGTLGFGPHQNTGNRKQAGSVVITLDRSPYPSENWFQGLVFAVTRVTRFPLAFICTLTCIGNDTQESFFTI
jgi:hypothetical protein